MALNTRRNASGRCHAAANAAIAPLLFPAMARSLAIPEILEHGGLFLYGR